MKRKFLFLLAMGMTLSLCACGDNSSSSPISSNSQNDESKQEHQNNQKTGQSSNSNTQSHSGLHFLCSVEDAGCYTENGFYYFTEDAQKLSDGSYGTHLMYMDFAIAQEIYLCNNAGCSHNTPDCPSVFLTKDFPSMSTMLFTYKNYLYILSKESDMDGSMIVSMISNGVSDDLETENAPTVLYRANLDGTNREKVYTFDSSITLEDIVLGGDNGIYVVTKKLTSEKNNENTYTNSSERKLVFVDVEAKTEKTICSLEFDNSISWKIVGCYEHTLVLSGLDYGKEVSNDELFNDDLYKNLYADSKTIFSTLDIGTGKMTQVYTINSKDEHAVIIDENMLYLSYSGDGSIKSVDLISGTEKNIVSLENNYLFTVIGDKLCCTSWDLASDFTNYFVDINTGEVSHSTLVNKCNGWRLEFRAELESEVLVVYDYEATKSDSDTYSISRYQYGLISKSDLINGVDNYDTIKMIREGR